MSETKIETPEVEEIDYKAWYEENQEKVKSFDSVVAKKDELLKETKQVKEEKRKQAELLEQARQKELEVAQKNGEFEKLWKQEQQEKERALEELQSSRKERRDEKINLTAMKIAVDLAKGDANKAELLSEFLAKSISKVADEYGNLDADIAASVRTQFETDKRYTPLLGGNLSVGSGAPGNTRSAPQKDNTITRSEFDKLDHGSRQSFLKKGGRLTDE